jgi:hypothetical protein
MAKNLHTLCASRIRHIEVERPRQIRIGPYGWSERGIKKRSPMEFPLDGLRDLSENFNPVLFGVPSKKNGIKGSMNNASKEERR